MSNLITAFLKARWRFKHWNRAKIRKFQEKQAKKIIQYAVTNSKFYNSYYNNENLNEISKLPLINKQIMMKEFTDFNTVGLTKEEVLNFCLKTEETRDFSKKYKGYIIGMSTGTSGNRGIEMVTKKEANLIQTTFLSRFPIPLRGRFHLAFILRVFSPGFNVNIGKFKMSYVSPMDTLENIIKKLNNIQPTVLSAPPSMLKILAKAKKENNLKISPNMVVSYAEVLSPDIKLYLERNFGTNVFEVYKCTEGMLGQSCKAGKMHINEDLAIIEVVDENDKPVPPGVPGHVIVTDLVKRTTPIIRYRLNDIITIDPDPNPCSCGSHFRVIKQIQGRADDMFLGRRSDTKKAQFIFGDYIRRAIVSTSDHIHEYRAIQENPKKIKIELELIPEFQTEDEQSIFNDQLPQKVAHLFEKHKCEPPEVEIKFKSITYDLNQKLRRIFRNFNESDFF
ncbi:MAG: F390 synthetase-related protein [Promethearchaeota archaeon]